MASSIWNGNYSAQAAPHHSGFQASAGAGNESAALEHLNKLGIYAAVASCFELAEKDRSAFDTLVRAASRGNAPAWAAFCVKLAKTGTISSGDPRMTDAFYEAARHIVLQARADRRSLVTSIGWPPQPVTSAKTIPFFPEKLRRHPSLRDRICAIAQDHDKLGPNDVKQAVLFSLGGLYDMTRSLDGTNPNGTTCFLFARSVLHAAGVNVISGRTDKTTCHCPLGFLELPGTTGLYPREFGWTQATNFGSPGGPTPRGGDVYLIRGDSYVNSKGQMTDSSHVGVIIDVHPTSWHVVEGGAMNHVTRSRWRKLIKKKGKWAFEDDTEGKVHHRPLYGWLSIDGIHKKHLMSPA